MEAKEPIVLVLTRDEAQAIADLTAQVAGTQKTRRRFTQAVMDQLVALGIRWQQDKFKPHVGILEFTE